MNPIMLKSKEAKLSEPWKGVKRKVLALTDNLMLIEVTLDKSSLVPLHKHFNEQIGYVVKGKIKMKIAKKWYLLKGGDSYCIPPNTEHKVISLVKSVVVDVFTPPVENFKKELPLTQ